MNVALPEVDGRIFTRAVAFKAAERFDARTECGIVVPRVVADRVAFVAKLAANWATLRQTPVAQRRIGLVLANYPNRDGRIGNGVGLDTPASAVAILTALREAGYTVDGAPEDGAALMDAMLAGRTNDLGSVGRARETLSLDDYAEAFAALPTSARTAMTERWGEPAADPFVRDGAFQLAVHRFGHVAVAVQPARGYNIDAKATYHDPALPPPHAYLAFHVWLERSFGAQAIVHVGKHGNLEWLPRKALALSDACFPEICAGPVPQLYPFIVNDPGEGTQAKRRIGAVIVDHLTPPLTRAESYGPLKQLEALADEYYLAAGMDPRRVERLRRDILHLAQGAGLDTDAGMIGEGDDALAALDNYLCELKEMQIRDGLHVFTQSPEGRLRRDLLVALARTPRGYDAPGQASLLRAMADDLRLAFDPLDCVMGEARDGVRPAVLAAVSDDVWRTKGDTVERLELLAADLVTHPHPGKGRGLVGKVDVTEERASLPLAPNWAPAFARVESLSQAQHIVPGDVGERTSAVLANIRDDLAPRVDACGAAEKAALFAGLNGRFVAARAST
jgi:cobaltochelatase CobN